MTPRVALLLLALAAVWVIYLHINLDLLLQRM